MTAILESRKLRIVDYLADLDDEALVFQIENLLFPVNNWWEVISDEERSSILRGIDDADHGRKVEFNGFIAQLRQSYANRDNG
ncbi:MAG: hypothetical protein ACKVU0_20955 [Saprospiraceae bacterium]